MVARMRAIGCTLAFGLSLVGCKVEELHAGAPSSSRWSEDTSAAWTAMQEGLVGSWRAAAPDNRTILTRYRLVSRDTALVESFTGASGRETLSVYHRDGRGLMLTHYCAQGNQARLRATEASREKVVFSFVDATDVHDGEGVMRTLAFTFTKDGFDLESVYRSAEGKDDASTLHFVRDDAR